MVLSPVPALRRGRRRRWPRRHRRPNGGGAGQPPAGNGSNGRDTLPHPSDRAEGAPPAPVRPCIIDWSDRVERAEAELQRAVVIITSINASPAISLEDAAEVIEVEGILFAKWWTPVARLLIICLHETKLSVISECDVLSILGRDFRHFVDLPAQGTRGGILVACYNSRCLERLTEPHAIT